eukprot:NODE_1774_length_1065_cov_191.269307.p1 GENE.NODE_1774_length_1065_cov_191.269307~~NODE_1774_length_1065_cov_191.269307.p1  ORF type:complete len:310 (-),score=51.34 NODE_1774_length_1065_cov_191.269307:119-976(-)
MVRLFKHDRKRTRLEEFFTPGTLRKLQMRISDSDVQEVTAVMKKASASNANASPRSAPEPTEAANPAGFFRTEESLIDDAYEKQEEWEEDLLDPIRQALDGMQAQIDDLRAATEALREGMSREMEWLGMEVQRVAQLGAPSWLGQTTNASETSPESCDEAADEGRDAERPATPPFSQRGRAALQPDADCTEQRPPPLEHACWCGTTGLQRSGDRSRAEPGRASGADARRRRPSPGRGNASPLRQKRQLPAFAPARRWVPPPPPPHRQPAAPHAHNWPPRQDIDLA